VRLWLDRWLGRLEHVFWRLLMLMPYRETAQDPAPGSGTETAAAEPAQPVKTMIRPEPAPVTVSIPHSRPMAVPLPPHNPARKTTDHHPQQADPEHNPETADMAGGMSTATFILLIIIGLLVAIGSFFI